MRTVYKRGTPVLEGLRYKGREGMFAWLLHRTTGLGILFFLVIHVVDIFLMAFGPDIFNALLVLYHAWWGRIMTVFLFFGVLFHALNGARIIIQDLWPRTWPHERKFIIAEAVVFVPVFLWGAYRILLPIFTH